MTVFSMSDPDIPLEEMDRAMATLSPAMTRNVLSAGLAGAAREVVKQARKSAPRITGLYRRSIRVRRKRIRVRDPATGKRISVPFAFAVAGAFGNESKFEQSFYAYFLEKGTRGSYQGTGEFGVGGAAGTGVRASRRLERTTVATRAKQLQAFRVEAQKKFRKLQGRALRMGRVPQDGTRDFPDVRDAPTATL